MARLEFENIGIKAMAGAVPANKIDNYKFTEYFDEATVKEVVDKVGVYERRVAGPDVTAADLCYEAAEKLIEDNELAREQIDVLIFVSQTADYRMPATAIILQDKLGLSKSTIAFDINLGCSGFIYGLSTGYSYLQQPGIRNVLLLDGETRTKAYSFKDRTTGFIFGDAGIAALLTKDSKFGQSHFSLNSDGGRHDLIKIDAGGYRTPSSCDTVKEEAKDEYGNIRSDEQGYMNGADVFNFVIREIPKDFKSTITQAKVEKEHIDFFVFHQANAFMNDYLKKKLRLPADRVPATIHKFGNTSSVSIPITIVSELQEKLKDSKRLLLCGFGVGLSWATAIINVNGCKISDIVEV